jgi:hypothetical protein
MMEKIKDNKSGCMLVAFNCWSWDQGRKMNPLSSNVPIQNSFTSGYGNLFQRKGNGIALEI